MHKFRHTDSSQPASATKTPATPSRVQVFKEKNAERYGWLVEPLDKQGRARDHEEYDPRTLLVPQDAWRKFTEFEKQFWEIKADHYDTVVFFKKGKFYELFENDADIGHQKFDLKLVDRRMVGVPESSFEHWASQFIAKGFKVAKVDQLETGIGKTLREKASAKIIRRELTSILTKGTLVDPKMLSTPHSTFCMAIKETLTNKLPTFGVAFVDTSTAHFSLATFVDDTHRSLLRTLLTQLSPSELVLEKHGLGKESLRVVKGAVEGCGVNWLDPLKEFWGGERTFDELSRGDYFDVVPDAVEEMKTSEVCMSALGGLVNYLRTELVSAGNFKVYHPARDSGTLILDGQTLVNLEIFQNSSDGGSEGTLFALLDHCSTPFGKRLLKSYSQSCTEIEARLDAVDTLHAHQGPQATLSRTLANLPDLERTISRIHAGSCRVKDFILTLHAFTAIFEMFESMRTYFEGCGAKLLEECVESEYGELTAMIEEFEGWFDFNEAAATGIICLLIRLHRDAFKVVRGVDEEYDGTLEAVAEIEAKLDAYILQQSKLLK